MSNEPFDFNNMDTDNFDWDRWAKYIIYEIKRLNNSMDKLQSKMDKFTADIAVLKIKSGIWGAIGGTIPFIVGAILYIIKETIK